MPQQLSPNHFEAIQNYLTHREGAGTAADALGHLMAARECVCDDRVLELETRVETQDRIIQHLTEESRKPWWRALADIPALIMWRRRARALARKNADLRWEIREADEAFAETYAALVDAYTFIHEQEWGWVRGKALWKECPECGTQAPLWKTAMQPGPEHDIGCKVGEAAQECRRVLHAGSRRVAEVREV